MPPLDAALALAQNLHVAVLVGQHLELDVPRRVDELFEIHVGRAERRAGFVLRLRVERRQFLGAASPPACRVRRRPPTPSESPDSRSRPPVPALLRRVASTPGEPGRIGTPISRMKPRARSFTPIMRITSGFGPMNLMPRRFADLGEVGVLAQKAVAGMDGVDVGDLRRADDRRNVEIAARALGRPDADGLVGEAHVRAVAVGLGVDGDRLDPQFLAGA